MLPLTRSTLTCKAVTDDTAGRPLGGSDDLAGAVPGGGFVTLNRTSNPKSSWRHFQAELPNGCRQADTTHRALADGADVEILSILDDHSRLLVASRDLVTAKPADVIETSHLGVSELGVPASILTDMMFAAESRDGTAPSNSSCSPLSRRSAAQAFSLPHPRRGLPARRCGDHLTRTPVCRLRWRGPVTPAVSPSCAACGRSTTVCRRLTLGRSDA